MSRDRTGFLRRTRHLIEYAALRAVAGAVGVLPERWAVRAGKALGGLFWLLSPPRRRIARRNVELAFAGQLNRSQVERIVRSVFTHIGLTAAENLWMGRRVTREDVPRRFPVEGLGQFRKARSDGRGALVFLAHLGNWELFGNSVAAQVGGVAALARPVDNPMIRDYVTRLRESFGIHVLSTRDGIRPMLRALQAGELLGVLIDQHVHRAFVPATFFGRKAATTAVVASLALRTNAPVFVAYSLRDGHSFRHHGYVEGPLELVRSDDREADVLANTQRFNDRLEELVRGHPEQWLWTHRRWKLAERGPERRKEATAHVG